MDTMLSLLVGPLGEAFQVIGRLDYLPKEDNFVEFSDAMYESYYRQCGMPDERMFYMKADGQPLDPQQLEVVSLSEKKALLQAKEFILYTLKKDIRKHTEWSEKDIINEFKSFYSILYPKNEKK